MLTLRVGALSVAVSLVPGILIGWLLARWESPLRALVQGMVMLPLVLPPVVTGYLLLRVLVAADPWAPPMRPSPAGALRSPPWPA